MRKRYRVAFLLVAPGLVGLAETSATGQNLPTAEDSLKGRIWTATARRVWADAKPKQPQPAPWATGADFTKWTLTQKEDKSELGLLRGAVIDRVGKGQTGTPGQVAHAIETEIAQRKQSKAGALARVDIPALQADLARLTPAAPTPPAAPPITNNSQAAAAVEDPTPTPDLPAKAGPMVAYQPQPAPYFGLSPAGAGALLALLGAAVGAGLYAALKPTRRSGRRHRDVPLSSEPATSTDMFKQDRAQKSEIQRLKGRIHHLEREVAELNAQLVPHASPAPTPDPAPIAASTLPSTDDDLLTVAPSFEAPVSELPTPTPPATRYGPVQETPFLEERKISDSPLPQLALMLTIHPGSPNEASFTLNPQVNQTMLIGDGLNRLQKFFEYDPPVGRISSVTAAAPGRLQRQADGWQVVERARLVIR